MTVLIECLNLTKRYGAKTALDNVTFNCDAGEPIALVGPNGAGKTTLFSIFCGYFQPSAGTIRLAGYKPGAKELFGQIAALPQDAQLDPVFSILRQLTFFAELQGFSRKAARIEASRTLDLMNLLDMATSLPVALSHGMRKRVAIAQTLIGRPRLVFLDEPTAGLDPVNAKKICQKISAISQETTFMISSHNIQELERLCDRVLQLENGRLKQMSTLAQPDKKERQSILTLRTATVDKGLFMATIKDMQAVHSITSEQRNEYIITYDAINVPDFDQQLLALLANKQWQYRSLVKGITLEAQLFSSTTL